MPRHRVLPCSVITSFCGSVIINFPFIISATIANIQLKFYIYRYVIEVRSSSLDLVQVRSLNLGKKKEIFCANKCKT